MGVTLLMYLQLMVSLSISLSIASGAASAEVGPSYRSVLRCFPALAGSDLESRMDMEGLQMRIDRIYPSLRSVLVQRKIVFQRGLEPKKRALLKSADGKQFEVEVEELALDGGWSVATSPTFAKKLSTLKDVGRAFAQYRLIETQDAIEESRTQNKILLLKKVDKVVQELELKNADGARRLLCVLSDEKSVICKCL